MLHEQFFVASFVYYITSTLFPAKETFVEEGEIDAEVPDSDKASVEKGYVKGEADR